MGRKITDKYANLRAALDLVLTSATHPMTVVDIAATSLMRDEGYTTDSINTALLRLVRLGNPPFPIKRIRVATGNNRWAYYNPTVLPQLEDRGPDTKPSKPAAFDPTLGPVGEFAFDPVQLSKEVPMAERPPGWSGYQPVTSPTVEVPPGVKSITIKAGGVSIQIELDTIAGAR